MLAVYVLHHSTPNTMKLQRTRRKATGVSAMLNVRYPAEEVRALDQAAEKLNVSRGAFMYAAIAREVRRVNREKRKAAQSAA